MQALSGQNLSFTTLPSVPGASELLPGYGSSPQSVNIISEPYIKRLVQAAFYPQPAAAKGKTTPPKKKAAPVPPASTVTVDVYNGGSQPGLAGDVSRALVSRGYQAGAVGDGSAQSRTVETGNQVFYGAGASANAAKIATDVGATAKALATLPAGHVEVLIGSTVTAVPASLDSAGASAAASPSASAAATAPAGSVSGGGTITVGANAKYGIPCVY
jgi:hypothetical protein